MSEAIEELVGRVTVLLRQAHADRGKAAGYRYLADRCDEQAKRAEGRAEEYQQILERLGELRVAIATEAIDAAGESFPLRPQKSEVSHEQVHQHEVTLNVTGNLDPHSIARQIERVMSTRSRIRAT